MFDITTLSKIIDSKGQYIIGDLTDVSIRPSGSFINDRTKEEVKYGDAIKLTFSVELESQLEYAGKVISQKSLQSFVAVVGFSSPEETLLSYTNFLNEVLSTYIVKHTGVLNNSGNLRLNTTASNINLITSSSSLPKPKSSKNEL